MMKIYAGKRTPEGVQITVQTVGHNGDAPQVRPLKHVAYHSPSGLEWGYGGSGPADLALSILCDLLDEHPQGMEEIERTQAWHFHQAFKWQVVSTWGEAWHIREDQVRHWLLTGKLP